MTLPGPQKPLQRYTPLARTSWMPRSGLQAARGGSSGAGPVRRGRRRSTGPTAAVWRLVQARDGGCVVGLHCAGRPDVRLVPNHRVNRGAGGSTDPGINLPSNLIACCNLDNAWLEDNPTRAYLAGWKVRHPTDPSTVSILYPDGVMYMLDREGGRRAA